MMSSMFSWLEPRSPFTATSSRLGATRPEIQWKIASAVLTVVCAGLLYFILQAPGRSSEARQAQIQELESQQRTGQARVAELRELTSRVQSATQSGQKFVADNFMGRANAFSSMLKNLEELATQNHLRPSNISYDLLDEKNELGWTAIEVSLSLEGEYADVVRFINKVEKSKIFWIIRGLDVGSAAETGLRMRLTTETYLLPS
ncbi:MAG: hypothetical protein EXQ56_07470 [Acidobacteria bacterium]|nr:hypothetical protein [Acidobacteriota bacterium]